MKKIICKGFALFFTFAMLLNLSACGKEADGKNVKIDSVLPDCVIYYPVCPECDHVGSLTTVDLSEGDKEEYKGMHTCKKCFEEFKISIKRK